MIKLNQMNYYLSGDPLQHRKITRNRSFKHAFFKKLHYWVAQAPGNFSQGIDQDLFCLETKDERSRDVKRELANSLRRLAAVDLFRRFSP